MKQFQKKNQLKVMIDKEDSETDQDDEPVLSAENIARTHITEDEEVKRDTDDSLDECHLKTQKQNFKRFCINLSGNTL